MYKYRAIFHGIQSGSYTREGSLEIWDLTPPPKWQDNFYKYVLLDQHRLVISVIVEN